MMYIQKQGVENQPGSVILPYSSQQRNAEKKIVNQG